MAEVLCAAIVAGGASRRMGRNKALLEIAGETMAARVARVLRAQFSQLIVVTSDTAIADAAHAPSIPDVFPGKGPLGGIHAALDHFRAPVFCVACDLPFLNSDAMAFLCSQLAQSDAVLPRVSGRAEPLHAVYAPSCRMVFERELQTERIRSVERVLDALRVRFVEENELRAFDADLRFLRNLNTPDDLKNSGLPFSL